MDEPVEQVGMARIHVTFDDPEATGMAGETVFAVRLRDAETPGHGIYRIDNIPFFVDIDGFGLNAEIECDETTLIDMPDSPMHGEPAIPEFVAVIQPATGKTVSVLFTEGLPNAVQLAIIDQITAAGGGIERATGTFWVVDMPPAREAEIRAILDSRLAMAHVEDFHVHGDDWPDDE